MDERSSALVHRKRLRIRPAFIVVEVTGILLEDGSPLPVRCVKPDPREMAEILRALPGERPAVVKDHVPEDETEEAFLALAPKLIERWALVEDEGAWVRGFTFSEPPDPDLIPGAELTFADVSNLAVTLMRLGGYLGGAAGDRFLGERGGSVECNGAVAAGERDRQDTVGSAH